MTFVNIEFLDDKAGWREVVNGVGWGGGGLCWGVGGWGGWQAYPPAAQDKSYGLDIRVRMCAACVCTSWVANGRDRFFSPPPPILSLFLSGLVLRKEKEKKKLSWLSER